MIKANSKTMEAFNNKIVGDNKNLELNVHSYLTSPSPLPTPSIAEFSLRAWVGGIRE